MVAMPIMKINNNGINNDTDNDYDAANNDNGDASIRNGIVTTNMIRKLIMIIMVIVTVSRIVCQ